MSDPLTDALVLLARGHHLYRGGYRGGCREADLVQAPALRRRAERFTHLATRDGMSVAASATLRTVAELRRAAAADDELGAVLAAARASHRLGHHGTRAILDDAYADAMPAADTPPGRREALRRMTARLRTQSRHIRRSRRFSHLLALRLRRIAYSHRRSAAQSPDSSTPGAIPLTAVRYHKGFTAVRIRDRVVAALNQLGITDPAAQRNWLHGYCTLIARESGGHPAAVSAVPATAPGPLRPDGHGLGYPRGLTQMLPATFAQYHQPGTSTNIYDPVANICASMNYVMHRYGVSRNGENLIALVQQADARRPPKGY
ncbi:hypothetical protein MBOT_10970 [Mycobacterium botniense]|uniref:Transglycosylase SLT domain-containing protein n=1 Tax=Mycobacterium botniense TaxID=84962 RepID=A0A7I9XUR2_9MYCO|nr:hypothetical protein MBOT_10970 [Mycobacterium botniense]